MSFDAKPILERLAVAESKGRLGHALLLVSTNAKQSEFAECILAFSKDLMCVSPINHLACGKCESCLAFQTSEEGETSQIDFYHLKPEKLDAYVLNQIKELRSFLSLRKALGRIKVIYIEDAQALGASGGAPANALLKILEEPRNDVKIILSSSRPEGILPTIRSRCQTFRFPINQVVSGFESAQPELLDAWSELFQWIERGAPLKDWPHLSLPADRDLFFKDRESARDTLKTVFLLAWEKCRNSWSNWDLEDSRQALEWFYAFETMMSSLKAYGQASLQWSSFKYRAKSS